MAKTFIWYSRKENAFVIIAHESLLNIQINPWIWRQEIPPGAGCPERRTARSDSLGYFAQTPGRSLPALQTQEANISHRRSAARA